MYYWSRVRPTLPPSLLPFFRSSSHPRAVFRASTHTFLGWVRWGTAPLSTTSPLPILPLPLLVPRPFSLSLSLYLYLSLSLSLRARRLHPAAPTTLHPRPNYEDQYTRKLARAAPTLLVCRPSSSVDLLRLTGQPRASDGVAVAVTSSRLLSTTLFFPQDAFSIFFTRVRL